MDIIYTDQQITELINEGKVLPDDWRTQLNKNLLLVCLCSSGKMVTVSVS